MKIKLTWFLFCIVFINGMAFGQETDPDLYCGTVGEEIQSKSVAYKSMTADDTYGEYITANGTLKVLVVFVRFPDDDSTHYHWTDPDPSWFPSMTDEFIDQSVSEGSTNYANITNYFDQMSSDDPLLPGKFQVIGDVVKVTAPKPSTHADYQQPGSYIKRREATIDVLNHIDTTTTIDFSEYDNWDAKGNFSHDNNPDGIVDMIFMIWKRGKWFSGWTGEASLGGGSKITLDGVDIKFGYWAAGNGSGITVHDNHNTQRTLNTTKHELGHWLLGSNHPYAGSTDNRIPSIMQHGQNEGLSATAPERERLGWITVPEITSTTGLELDDFITTGEAYKYDVTPGSSSDDEFYYITNHQKLSIYDDATNNTSDTGLFILHDKNSEDNSSSNRMLVSDGDYIWDEDGTMDSPWDNNPNDGILQLSVFYKDYPSQNGINFTQMLYSSTQSKYEKLFAFEEDGDTSNTAFFQGHDFISAFNKESRTLFSSITNPAARNWSGDETTFGLHVRNQAGNILSFDVDVSHNPYSITENTTWDGHIFLEEDTEVTNNATLTILHGTTVYLEEDVDLIIRPGAKLIAEGTQQDPIVFRTTEPANEPWGDLLLESSAGNSLEWAVLDGGDKNLNIQSKNNSIQHVTSRYGTYGIYTGSNQDGSGNSDAVLKYCLIEDNSSHGISARYTNLDISYTTIQDNGGYGLNMFSSSSTSFHHNLITENSSYADGIYVSSSGALLMRESLYLEGHNEVSGNGDDQISNYGALEVGQGYNGENSIHGNYSGTKYLVDNQSGSTVDAVNTWWGQSPPNSNMFAGSVDYSAHVTSDPLSGITHGHDGQAPAKVQGVPASIKEEYDRVESLLSQAKSKQQVRDRLHQLFMLTFQEADSALTSRFNEMARDAASGLVNLQSGTEVNKAFQNYAKVLYPKSLIRDEQYEEADAFLTQLDTEDLTGFDMRDYLHLKMVTETYHGRYQQAWQTLQEYYTFQESQGEDMEEVRAHNSVIEEDLKALMESGEGKTGGREKTSEEISAKEKLSLNNYPNPFNPTTNIRFTLPVRSQVSLVVYDMLGREVATLVNKSLRAGEQTVRFDASRLANGVYLYKLRTGSQELTRKMTLIK